MKRLTCEVCGSADLIKQDGVFVCQSCGCKYSVEEAKKLMVEGVVEIQGSVTISNSAQIDNLTLIAKNALKSKNYKKAEECCDQIISMEKNNYDAWKIKAEAISGQTTSQNTRILEANNCFLEAINILKNNEGNEVDKEKEELEKKIKSCLESELDFWLVNFETNRPTDEAYQRIEKSFLDCCRQLSTALNILNPSSAFLSLQDFQNNFSYKANVRCVSAWKTTVGYNYFREEFDNLGAGWNRELFKFENISHKWYRPNLTIWKTFIDETMNLIKLLTFCTVLFNNSTPLKTKTDIYDNLVFFYNILPKQVSYVAKEQITTNAFGAVLQRQEYYSVDRVLSDQNKLDCELNEKKNRAKKQEAEHEEVLKEQRKKKQEEENRKRQVEQKMKEEEEAKKDRISKYWSLHSEEKKLLESEKNELQKHISETERERQEELNKINEKIALASDEKEEKEIIARIKRLNDKFSSLGILKIKEKKEIQEQIAAAKEIAGRVHNQHLENRRALEKEMDNIRSAKDEIIRKADRRIKEIEAELFKDRNPLEDRTIDINDKETEDKMGKGICSFVILKNKCKGCTGCARKCPEQCIIGEYKNPFTIDQSRCTRCGICKDFCKFDAIAIV